MADVTTPGRDALVAWMAANPKERTQGYIARVLGVSQPAVGAWVHGRSRPDAHYREPIEQLTGIKPEDWELPEEAARRERALANIQELETGGNPTEAA